MTLSELIQRHRVLICVGSGGVGKTTVSASLAVYAAKAGLKVLVMTIDPSRRLKVALGLAAGRADKVLVPQQNYHGKIFASLLDAEQIFRDFITETSADQAVAERLLNNRVYKALATTLSGSQEFTSLLQLSRIVGDKDFDLIILDTPPSQHAVQFLEAPEKLNALFQDSIVKWFVGSEEQLGIFRKIISQGTRTVLGALERITGSVFMRELSDFFVSVRAVQGKISTRSSEVENILRSPHTGFVLITGFDQAKMSEASTLFQYLSARSYNLAAAVVNRAFALLAGGLENVNPAVQKEYARWQGYHAEREAHFQQFSERWTKRLPVVRIPDLNRELEGLQGLEGIANEMDLAFNTARGSH